MLSIVYGEPIIINAIDEEGDNYGNTKMHPKEGLPQQITLKLNMLIKLYVGNYDINDGLVNGVDGILKAYTSTNKIDII